MYADAQMYENNQRNLSTPDIDLSYAIDVSFFQIVSCLRNESML